MFYVMWKFIVKRNNNFMNYLRYSNNLKTIYFLKYLLYVCVCVLVCVCVSIYIYICDDLVIYGIDNLSRTN
jgi:hypothetical protein